jgi:hypothetical protein
VAEQGSVAAPPRGSVLVRARLLSGIGFS